jgi:hypothetical protein
VANAGVRGRPIEPLVLSAQERAYLERQVSRPTSVPSSTCTTKTQSPSNGPSPLTRFWLPSNASVTKLSRLYVANFRFT